jgi:dipeptidase D
LQRANAITLLADTLTQLQGVPFHLSFFEGGSLRNAIPREARAVFTCAIQYKARLDCLMARLQANLQSRYHAVEDNLQLSLKACALPETVLAAEGQNNLLIALKDCPNGVFEMDENLVGVVQTSSNLGVLTQGRGEHSTFTMEMLVRSQVEAEKQHYMQKIFAHFQQYGATCRKEGDYPGWKPNPDSAIYKIVQAQYSKLFDAKSKTMVIHAGLECGLFLEKYPNMDMISFGPTLKAVHSPDERIDIETVQKFWDLLLDILKNVPAK